jgi:hypothetical protein
MNVLIIVILLKSLLFTLYYYFHSYLFSEFLFWSLLISDAKFKEGEVVPVLN